MKVLLTIEYKGTNFEGWQVQPKKRTVQEVLEETISKLLNEKISLFASGRTDSGVHALAQCAHFESGGEKIKQNFFIKNKFNSEKLVNAINANLPEDVKIIKAKRVSNKFHARFDVKEKKYIYKLEIGTGSPLTHGLVGTYKHNLDIEKMKKGSDFLVGTHDFRSFSSVKTEVQDFVRTINYIKIYQLKDNEIIFEISGNGFLYNMVRIIVGTLIDIGDNKISPEDIKIILDAKDRTKAGKTVAPEGLYLKEVRY